jgi:SAM-dependent methyltransferase
VDAGDWDDRYASVDQVWSTSPNQFVAAELADLTPGRAIDLACGEGRNAIWLAGRGWQVTALDFSQVAVDRGRRVAGDDLPIEWRVDDALTAELPSAGLVVLAYLQLPEEQRRTAVRRGFATLEPGGTFFLVAHDSTNLAEGTGGPQDPSVLYTAEDVLADLEGEHFEVVRATRVARVVSHDDEHGGTSEATAWDALVRLVRH